MLVLITYDINTITVSGRKRLSHIAKECQNYGQRVQNSVFECEMDAAKSRQVKSRLLEIINKNEDSLRIYYIGKHPENKVEHYGIKPSLNIKGTLIF